MLPPVNSSPLTTHKRIFVDRDAIREAGDCFPVVVYEPATGDFKRVQDVKVLGPSRTVFSPSGFMFGVFCIRIWVETDSPVEIVK